MKAYNTLTIFKEHYDTEEDIIGLRRLVVKNRIVKILVFTFIFCINSIVFANVRDNIGFSISLVGTAEKIIKLSESKSTTSYLLRSKDGTLLRVHSPYETPKIGEVYRISGILYTDYQSGKTFISEKTRQIIIDDPEFIPIEGKTYKDVNLIDKNLIKIHHDIDNYKKEFVEISGKVVKHYKNSNWYQVKGKYGTTLDVQGFQGVPVVHSEVKKCGILYIDSHGTPFLSELPEISIVNSKISRLQNTQSNKFLLTILGVVFFFGTGVAVTTYVKKIKNSEPEILINSNYQPTKYEEVDDTLIFSTSSKTAKILPGRITIVSEAHDKGETFPISGTPIHDGFTATIGKSENCDITITNRPEYSTVSREHAMFIFKENSMWIQNLSKTNPTIVNGSQLEYEVVPLKDGDRIKMGLLELLFETFG